jgi:hypothetical protein
MSDPLTVAAWVALGIAVLFVLSVVAWAILHRRPVAPSYAAPAALQPYSISRALDDLKYQHADRIIGETLGVSHANGLGSVLGGMSPSPKAPEAPKA